jgi:beta-1,2-mannobiose phosphorylase / 1,2-beta-oligomannan phosphorylase
MLLTRHPMNPLITPQSVRPSRADYEVIGTFNAGATTFQGETLLLVRVAERPTKTDPNWIFCPYIDANGDLTLREVRRDDPEYDTRDPRFVVHRPTRAVYLTSMSHVRLARSTDGVHFTTADRPWLNTASPFEAFGVEDARITCVDDMYYINYTAVSSHGIATGLVTTKDFDTVERLGIMFPPSNRDVVVFPQKVNGLYVCYHRPMPGEFGQFNMWMATSPDMIHWGNHQLVLAGNADGWDSGRVGGGAPAILTDAGWLSIYHAADKNNRYCLGAFLTSRDDPATVLYRSQTPIFEPEAPYETSGFFGNVVFTCGLTVEGDTLRVYYGASDETIALAEAPIQAIVDHLRAGN